MSAQYRRIALATGLWMALGAGGTAAAEADMEARLSEVMAPAFDTVLQRTGSKIAHGSKEWQAALKASVAAVLAVKPQGCSDEEFLTTLCGLRPFLVPSTAMAPTLQEGDILMAEQPDKDRPLRRGDIVAFHPGSAPGGSSRDLHIFRIVGMPGESIQLRDGGRLRQRCRPEARADRRDLPRLHRRWASVGVPRDDARGPHLPDRARSFTVGADDLERHAGLRGAGGRLSRPRRQPRQFGRQPVSRSAWRAAASSAPTPSPDGRRSSTPHRTWRGSVCGRSRPDPRGPACGLGRNATPPRRGTAPTASSARSPVPPRSCRRGCRRRAAC